jgi:hypothetical protein
MDLLKLRQHLKSIILDLQSVLAELEPTAVDRPEEPARTTCPVCAETLGDGTRIVRGVHERCYQRLRRECRLADAELSGILLPKEKTGRKTKINLDEVLLNAKSIEALAVQKTTEHRKKSKS